MSVRRIWHLGTCDTCERILARLPPRALEAIELRAQPLTPALLDELIELAGGVEPLFSRRARLYRELGLHQRDLAPSEQRELILRHDTFLARPVAVVDGRIYIGSAPRTVAALEAHLASLPAPLPQDPP